jgi:hypothetical protein
MCLERIISMVEGKAQLNLEYNNCDLCVQACYTAGCQMTAQAFSQS